MPQSRRDVEPFNTSWGVMARARYHVRD